VSEQLDNPELRALLERAQQGDPAAFSELYGRYASHVLRFLMARLRDHELAQDLTQEVFIRILKAIGGFRYQGERSFLSWMFAIASNVMISYVRRAKATHISLDEELELADPHGQAAVSGIVNRVSLQQAMSRLTEDQQQVLLLRFYADLSNAEIARQIGKTEGAVKALQHRALQTLQQIMGRENGEPNEQADDEASLFEQGQQASRVGTHVGRDIEPRPRRAGFWR
jgi:RNA polymerase sigma-70 factor (ECF subfamily)